MPEIALNPPPFNPAWEKGDGGMRGKNARECSTSPIAPKNSSGVRCAPSPTLSPGRFFGKPLRAIFRFSHQDAQAPPSPRVGEGGWGDEGQRRTGMQHIAHRAQKLVRRSFRARGAPPMQTSGARRRRARGWDARAPHPPFAGIFQENGAAGCFQSGGGPPSQSASNSSIDSSTDSSPASTASRYRDTHV
jgi:hypothetical protein